MPLERLPQGPSSQLLAVQVLQIRHRHKHLESAYQLPVAEHLSPPAPFGRLVAAAVWLLPRVVLSALRAAAGPG